MIFFKQVENTKDSRGLFSPTIKPLAMHINNNEREFHSAKGSGNKGIRFSVNGMKPDFDRSEPSTALKSNPHKPKRNKNTVSNGRTGTATTKKSNEMCSKFRNIQRSVKRETIQMDIRSCSQTEKQKPDNQVNHTKVLQEHIKTCTDEKPYKCDVCGKVFSRLDNLQLQVHMRTHSGERPYRCDVCGMSFSQSSSLQTHEDT
jgi:uncharacterized Zn-finger protein